MGLARATSKSAGGDDAERGSAAERGRDKRFVCVGNEQRDEGQALRREGELPGERPVKCRATASAAPSPCVARRAG
jgi:hypothetical protein